MIFFLVTCDFHTDTATGEQQFLAAAHPNYPLRNSPERVYCTTVLDLRRLEDRIAAGSHAKLTHVIPEDLVRSVPGFPVELGVSNHDELARALARARGLLTHGKGATSRRAVDLRKQLLRIRNKTTLRVAILNGLGTGIGDTLVGLTALAEAHQQMQRLFRTVVIDVLVGVHCYQAVLPVYAQSPLIRAVHPLPITLADLAHYDVIFDTGSLMHREEADRLPYVDFFLRTLGVDYRKVDPARKRNTLRVDAPVLSDTVAAIDALKADGRRLLLFHPTASGPLRSMPDERIDTVLEELIAHSDYHIATVVPIPFQHPRVSDLSGVSSDFQRLCHIVSQMDAVVCVDTSIYHIADAFGIPTVVLFTSIDPELRVKYYPFVDGMLLSGARDSGYFGRHYLETGRSLEPVLDLWKGLDVADVLDRLTRMTKTCHAQNEL